MGKIAEARASYQQSLRMDPDDEDVQQHYEGLAATLKAAKKRELLALILDEFGDVWFLFCIPKAWSYPVFLKGI